jgi:hypothetical protein
MDEAFYQRAMRRVYRDMLVVGAAGAVVLAFWKGWTWGLMFLAGAAASYFNFSWLHQAVEGLGPGARPPRKRVVLFLLVRYTLLGLGGYIIVNVFGMNAIGALIGLFIAVAAIFVEMVYELVHAGT